LTPIFGDSSEIFAANNWVRKYFPNLKLKTTQKKFRKKNFLERILNEKFGDFLEKILRNWQLNRAMRKQKNREKNTVIISEDILKFHETDQRRDFQERWKKRITAKSGAKK
jgi:heme oxygenase